MRIHAEDPDRHPLVQDLEAIAHRAAGLPVLDGRPEADVLAYDADGLPA